MEAWNVDLDRPEKVAAHISALASRATGPFIVCIDYFDTIAIRRVAPEHTKSMACAVLSQLLGGVFSGADLYARRQELERVLTTRNGEENGELDFSLDVFSSHYWEVLNGLQPGCLRCDPDSFTALLLRIEVAVEQAVQAICPQMLRLLELLQQKGFPLVLVSDFYLPDPFFRAILQSLQVEHFFERIYISSSLGSSKGSGRVYRRIAEEYRCTPGQMLMIGDNLHADIHMARQFGMLTLHVQRPVQQELYAAFARKRNGDNPVGMADFLDDLPLQGHFSEMACSLWLFTHKLFHALWSRGERDVFFLSKEGEFLRRLFDSYQQLIFGSELIRSHYLLASRKATFLASLRELADEDFRRLLAHYRDISLDDFLRSLNFPDAVIEDISRFFPGDFTERKHDLGNTPEFARLLTLPVFRQCYADCRRQQRSNFRGYLDSFGVDYRAHGLSLVDVGWKGSIQDNIYHILDGETTVEGYFVGIFHATERHPNNRKRGLLFDNTDGMTPYYAVYNSNRSLYEMLLGATHGSADHYLLGAEFLQASGSNRYEEYIGIDTEAGRLRVMVLDLPEERMLYRQVIQPLQENMMLLFERLTAGYLLGDCHAASEEWFARRHARMVFSPKMEEIDFFAGLFHLENFGIFEYTNFQSDSHLSLGDRWKNLLTLAKDRSILESGIWPPIILRRLGLGFLQRLDGLRRIAREFPGS